MDIELFTINLKIELPTKKYITQLLNHQELGHPLPQLTFLLVTVWDSTIYISSQNLCLIFLILQKYRSSQKIPSVPHS